MRLDHLLSKEHNTSTPTLLVVEWPPDPANVWMVVAQGISEPTNRIPKLALVRSCLVRPAACGGGCGTGDDPRVKSGCLLAYCWVLRQHARTMRLQVLGFVVLLVVSGVVFENCRVDASIFVVKLCRAHGGCLGIRGR